MAARSSGGDGPPAQGAPRAPVACKVADVGSATLSGEPPLSEEENPIALALGGGGARGLAHIGVFKVLIEESVPIDMMVGTSIGAIGVALFGLRLDWKHWRDVIVGYLDRRGFGKFGKGLTDDLAGRSGRPPNRLKTFLGKSVALLGLLLRKSLVSRKHLRRAVEGVCPDKTFADLVIPGAAVMLDLVSCEEVIVREGSLRDACTASANLAGFFPPYEYGDKLLVDASPVSSVPVDASRRLGAAGVIAVDIRSGLKPTRYIPSGADAAFRVMVMATERANREQIVRADVVIAPGVEETYWSDFRDFDAHIAAGEAAARKALPEITKLLEALGRA